MPLLSELSALVAVIAPVFLVAGVGYLWVRARLPFDTAFVTAFVVNVATPCLVFKTLTGLTLETGDLAVVAGATLAVLAATAVLAAAALAGFGLSLRTYLPAMIFPNSGNMGLPVCLFAFGEAGMGFAVICFAVLAVIQFVAGPAIAAGRLDPAQLLRLPILWAVAGSLAARGLEVPLPVWLANTTGLLGSCAVPLMLVALGVALARLPKNGTARVLGVSVLRLSLGFAVGWVVTGMMGLDGVMRGVLVVESAMPVAVFNYLWAQKFGTAPEEVAGAVLGSTVLSFLTLPLVLYAVG